MMDFIPEAQALFIVVASVVSDKPSGQNIQQHSPVQSFNTLDYY